MYYPLLQTGEELGIYLYVFSGDLLVYIELLRSIQPVFLVNPPTCPIWTSFTAHLSSNNVSDMTYRSFLIYRDLLNSTVEKGSKWYLKCIQCYNIVNFKDVYSVCNLRLVSTNLCWRKISTKILLSVILLIQYTLIVRFKICFKNIA